MISVPGVPAAIVDRSEAAGQSATGPVVSVLRGNVVSTGVASCGGHDTAVAALLRALVPWPRAALAASSLGGIRASIEGTDVVGWTDDAGGFELRGDVSGPVAVLLERDDGIAARVPATVPRGGTVTLPGIDLDSGTSPVLVDFDGVVVDHDCAADLVRVASRFEREGPIYTIDLASSTARSTTGLPVPCVALSEGRETHVEGGMDADGTIHGARLTAPPALAMPALPAIALPTAADRPSPVPTMELPAVPPTP